MAKIDFNYAVGSHPDNPVVIPELNHSAEPFLPEGRVLNGGILWLQFLKIGPNVEGIGVASADGGLILGTHTGASPSLAPTGIARSGEIAISDDTTYVSVQADSPGNRLFALKTLNLS
jgi:hypothetical protein